MELRARVKAMRRSRVSIGRQRGFRLLFKRWRGMRVMPKHRGIGTAVDSEPVVESRSVMSWRWKTTPTCRPVLSAIEQRRGRCPRGLLGRTASAARRRREDGPAELESGARPRGREKAERARKPGKERGGKEFLFLFISNVFQIHLNHFGV